MVDRTDIDALLIGSLYGELSSADEARLRAHLESHPADRTALEGLTRTREAVRASRIFQVQLEPPQSVSALLLQEAVRRAPRKVRTEEREGWFDRLRRAFMHPAMAAATMLVLVVGVAGTLYLRKGDHFAAPESSSSAPAPEQAAGSGFGGAPAAPVVPAPTTAATPPGEAPQPQMAADEPKPEPPRGESAKAHRDQDSYRVGIAEGHGARGDLDTASAPAPTTKPAPRPASEVANAEKKKLARSTGPGSLLQVTTPQRTPKELDDEERSSRLAKGRAPSENAKEARPMDVAPAADPEVVAKVGTAPAGPAPAAAPPATGAMQGVARAPSVPSGGGSTGAVAGGEDRAGKLDTELAWAKDQHTRLVVQVRAGRCADAAGTAVALSNRAPTYYQQNVENDRSVKECLAYINAERERAAEVQRARAATARRATEESASQPAPKQAVTQKKSAAAKPAASKADAAKDAPAATTKH